MRISDGSSAVCSSDLSPSNVLRRDAIREAHALLDRASRDLLGPHNDVLTVPSNTNNTATVSNSFQRYVRQVTSESCVQEIEAMTQYSSVIDMRHMRYFVAVVGHRSFRRAASELNVSQPPLTTQTQQPQDKTGARLLDRNRD